MKIKLKTLGTCIKDFQEKKLLNGKKTFIGKKIEETLKTSDLRITILQRDDGKNADTSN